jgi:peptidoglycan/xylan/chitin deacetylase (PgdA/CDA1 family)
MNIITTIDFEGEFQSEKDLKNELFLILDLLNKKNVNVTFFVVGKLLKKYKNIFQLIPKNHEIAIHGFTHKTINNMSYNDMKKEITNSKKELLSIRNECLGFRSPLNLIHKDLSKVLATEKFVYDSSLNRTFFPGRYYNRNISNVPYKAGINLKKRGDLIYEIPISSYTLFKVPFGLSFLKAFYPFYNPQNLENYSTFYMHNYEITNNNYPKIKSKLDNYFLNKNKERGPKILKKLFSKKINYISCKDFLILKNVI